MQVQRIHVDKQGKKTKQQHKEKREGGKKIVVGNMTKLLLSPYGCSTSDLRGQRTFLFFLKNAVNIAHVSSLQCKSMVRMLFLIVWLCVCITCITQAFCRTRRRPGTQLSSFVWNRGAKAMKNSKRI